MKRTRLRLPALLPAALLATAIVGLPEVSPAQSQQLSPEARQQIRAFVQACRTDIRQFCQGIQPGEGRIFSCLQENSGQASQSCQSALANPPNISGQ